MTRYARDHRPFRLQGATLTILPYPDRERTDLKLSKESRYAMSALAYLATLPKGAVAETAKVASATGIPRPFLAKIFVRLTHQGLLASHRGRERGYSLALEAGDISVRQILEAIDGPDLFLRCLFWGESCSDSVPCPLHQTWQNVRPKIAHEMESTSLAQIAAERRGRGGPEHIDPAR